MVTSVISYTNTVRLGLSCMDPGTSIDTQGPCESQDDLVLYRPIHSAADYHLLQIDIDNICVWSDDNHLKFNGRKCKYMIIIRRKQPSLPVTPLKIKQTCLERVHSYRYLGVWLTPGLCKSVKYVKKQGNKWVFYTENSIHLQILHHSCNCIWPTSDHIWNTLYLYGTPINGDLSAPWRECRSSHLRCAGVLDIFASVMQPAYSCLQKTLSETVPPL